MIMSQEQFNEQFITTREIASRVGVSVAAVIYAHKRDALPGAIEIQNSRMFLWNRKQIEPELLAWERRKKGVAA